MFRAQFAAREKLSNNIYDLKIIMSPKIVKVMEIEWKQYGE